jgi:LmbE family N-acetylglucosaminyl deacetylase
MSPVAAERQYRRAAMRGSSIVGPAEERPIALSVIAHPDDESVGVPVAHLMLRDAGYHVVVLACGLGNPGQETRREAELLEATRRAGFSLLIASPPINLSRRGMPPTAEPSVLALIREAYEALDPALVIGPHPHDAHPAHELVGRAVRGALEQSRRRPARLWMWSIWADLAVPTLYVPFDQNRLGEAAEVLRAYEGELDRIDYLKLLQGRAEANSVLGSERVFGFGSQHAHSAPYAELLTELVLDESCWLAGERRILEDDCSMKPPTASDISWLFSRPSFAAEFAGHY